MNENNYYNSIVKNITSLFAVLLPFIQFAFQWLPERISILFIDKNIFFFTSLITLLLSIFIILIYESNPYLRFRNPFSKKKREEYSQYLKNTDPRIHKPEVISRVKVVTPPLEITGRLIASVLILVIFIASLLFIWLGMNYGGLDTVHPVIPFIQAFIYMLIFTSSVFILMSYALESYGKNRLELIRKTRINKAINLAKEHDSFSESPRVIFFFAKDNLNTFPQQFIVEVFIDRNHYRIVTDHDAEVLYAVYRVDEEKIKSY